MWIKLRMLSWGDYIGLSRGGPNITTRVLIGEKGGHGSQIHKRRYDDRNIVRDLKMLPCWL